MFTQKIKKFKELLEFIYPDLFDSHSVLFENIEMFKDERNKMAHCYFTWDEADLTSVTIWDLDESKLKHVPYQYFIRDLFFNLEKSKSKIIAGINPLAKKIFERLMPEIPNMFED